MTTQELGTCKFYVSPEQPECGKKATAVVKTPLLENDEAAVELCAGHKRRYDHQAAARRRKSKAESGVDYLTKSSGRTRIEI